MYPLQVKPLAALAHAPSRLRNARFPLGQCLPRISAAAVAALAALSFATIGLSGCGERTAPEVVAEAKARLAAGDRTAAIVEFKQAITLEPKDAEIRFLLGSVYAAGNQWPQAEVELQAAKDLGYAGEQVVPLYVKALLENRQYKKLADGAASLRVDDPTQALAVNTAVATGFARTDDMAKATALLEQVLSKAPDYVPARLLRARMMLTAGDTTNAAKVAQTILASDAKNVEALQLDGEIKAYGGGDLAEAAKAFQAVLAEQPWHLNANLGLFSILLSQGKADAAQQLVDALAKRQPNAPQTRFMLAQVAFAKHNFDLARTHILQLLKVAPENGDFLQLAGTIEFESDSWVQAERYLSKALAKSPGLALSRRTLARIYARTDRPAKALQLLAPLLDTKVSDGEALLIGAEAYQYMRDPKAAEALYIRAAKIIPDDSRVRTAIALSRITKGNAASALAELQNTAETYQDGVADMALIRAYLVRNDVAAALNAVDGLEKKHPDQPLASNLRGRIDLFKRDVAGARRHFERALTLDAGYFPAANSLASLDVLDGKRDLAVSRFEGVIKTHPRHVQAALAIAGIRARGGADKETVVKLIGEASAMNPGDPAPRIMLIDYLTEQRDLKGAHAAAQAGMTAVPDHPDIIARLARTQLDNGEINQAVASYSKLVSIRPTPASFAGMANAQQANNNVEAAVQTYRRLLEWAGERRDVQRDVVAALIRMNRHDSAVQVATDIQRKNPADAIGPLLLGDIDASRGKWAEALAHFRSGLGKQGAEQVPMRIHAALLFAKRGDEAAGFATEWIKSHPRDDAFLFYFADVALASRDLPAAEQRYRAVLKLDPANGRALNNVAWLMLQQRKAGALEFAEKALAQQPTNPATQDTYAMALVGAGQLPKAIDVLVALAASHPENLQNRVNLAALYLKAGDKTKAAGLLKDVQAQGSKFSNQKDVERLLKQI